MKNILKAFRYFIAIPVFLCLLLFWIICVVAILPFVIVGRIFYKRKRRLELDYRVPEVMLNNNLVGERLMFNRTMDIPKIYGCNVRNVRYRWKCFSEAIEELTTRSRKEELNALDLGAGSLRETYELSRLGFRVTAIDYDAETLNTFKNCYNWNGLPYYPEIVTEPLNSRDTQEKFQLALSFDILEHNLDYEAILMEIKMRLANGGLYLVTVPNGRSLIETYWKLASKYIGNSTAAKGEAHVVFLAPHEWRDTFTKNGFTVVRHDMAIGYLVNTWRGIYSIIIDLFVEPVIRRTSSKFGINYIPYSIGELFYPDWLMENIHFADLLFEPLLKKHWGWNLFVLTPTSHNLSDIPTIK